MKKFLYEIITEQREAWYYFPLKIILWGISHLYRLIITTRLFLYQKKIIKQNDLSCPVISVGNITWGGVGKTPLVALITQTLKARGLKVVVLMRGYMDKFSNSLPEGSKEGIVSDEGLMLKENVKGVPILIGPHRYINALKHLENDNVDVFVLDDGFQHLSLKRDLDIVAIDVTNPFGNGHLLPRGILRESKSSLNRADMIVLTKTDLAQEKVGVLRRQIESIVDDVPIVETVHAPVGLTDVLTKKQKPLSYISHKNICSLCSIGDPISFERLLDRQEVNRKKSFSFMDHYAYSMKDIINVFEACDMNSINTIVTTEKDAVKLRKLIAPANTVSPKEVDASSTGTLNNYCNDFKKFQKIELLSLNIEVVITNGKEQFFQRIDNLLVG